MVADLELGAGDACGPLGGGGVRPLLRAARRVWRPRPGARRRAEGLPFGGESTAHGSGQIAVSAVVASRTQSPAAGQGRLEVDVDGGLVRLRARYDPGL